MSENTHRIEYLFKQYMNKTCSRNELQELFDYIGRPEYRELLEQMMDTEYEVLQPLAAAQDVDWDYIYQQVTKEEEDQNIYPLHNRRRFRWLNMAAAAVITLTVGLGTWWWLNRLPKQQTAHTQPANNTPHDVMPGSNKAVLTLANGSKVILDSAANGLLAQQGNANIMKTANGQLVYTKADEKSGNPLTIHPSPLTYNTMATPRGGQYQLILPDGSKVWLNAASSIRYPTAFTGNERKVEITGEVYFEIEKLRNKSGQKIPFKVIIAPSPLGESRGEVEVLGTHFNINAYDDEASSKVTLLEGMVKVMKEQGAEGKGQRAMNANDEVILKPGEQAVLAVAHSPLTIDHSPDLEQVMSWKNGFTAFKSADIKSIMRQVARWYDVDVKFEGTIPERTFTGGVSRSASLSELLRLLEVSKVHFKLNGKELIVTE